MSIRYWRRIEPWLSKSDYWHTSGEGRRWTFKNCKTIVSKQPNRNIVVKQQLCILLEKFPCQNFVSVAVSEFVCSFAKFPAGVVSPSWQRISHSRNCSRPSNQITQTAEWRNSRITTWELGMSGTGGAESHWVNVMLGWCKLGWSRRGSSQSPIPGWPFRNSS